MRSIGLDYGQKRIGIAVSDSQGRVALPVASFVRTKDRPGDIRRLANLLREYEPKVLVVGLPLQLSGRMGSSAQSVDEFVVEIGKVLDVEIVVKDERFSTQEAARLLREANHNAKQQRSIIDASAAAVILQAWLDSRTRI